MANPVNRTLIACSVSALALAIVTLCYWKLRKRRLLSHDKSSSSSSNGICPTTDDCVDSSSSSSSSQPNQNKSTATGKDSLKLSNSSSSSSFPLLEENSQPDIVDDQFTESVSKPSFADIARDFAVGNVSDVIEEDEELKDGEEIDSLRVEVSSVCSSTLSRDVIEEDDTIDVENESVPEQKLFEAELKNLDQTVEDKTREFIDGNKADIDNLTSLLTGMQISETMAVAVQNIDMNSQNAGSKNETPVKPAVKLSISGDEVDSVGKQLDELSINQQQKTSAKDTSSSATNGSSAQATTSTNGPSSDNNSVKAQPDSKSKEGSPNPPPAVQQPKKAPRTFTSRRPNTTFAQALSAKAGQVNGSGHQPTPAEMSIDAYQNYPDSPAQNSQCSPMSELSDQQSMHSSDSGAGSDSHNAFHQPTAIAPSPLVTSNGQEEICYQFTVPFELCGQLIGSKGHFINNVKRQSYTNCVISANPIDPHGSKTCSVYGTSDNVTRALNLIRARFPIEEFPEMTLVQTNIVPVPTVELNTSCNLTLLPEIDNDAILSCSITPSHIFVQQPTHPTHPNLQTLEFLMKRNYSQPNVPGVPQAVPGMICVIQNGLEFFRAHVKSVSPSGLECEIVFVDYGGFATVSVASLKQIKLEFLNLPFQACECYLFNIAPVDDFGWSEDAYTYFFQELTNKVIQVRIAEIAEDQVPLVKVTKRLEDGQTICINNELVKRGHAKWIDESRVAELLKMSS